MSGKEMLEGMSFVHSKYVQEAEGKLPERLKKPIHFRKKPLLIAAIIGTTIFLMGAAINAMISMRVDDVMVNTPSLETLVNEDGSTQQNWIDDWHEGEKISFDEVYDVFIELGSYYPQEIPAGYSMVFVSDTVYKEQIIRYENEAGSLINYTIYVPHMASDIEIYDISVKTDVKINGHDGILYETKSGNRTLVWIDEKQGYGFRLHTGDQNVDLIAMAESTSEGEPLVPSNSHKTVEALEELGDFEPEYLPDGYVENGVLGSPIGDGGGWYSYVRKWYVNKAENTQIYFEYETCHSVTEDGNEHDAKTVCSYFIPGYERGTAVYEEVEVNGMYGLATEERVVWADPAVHKVYHLTSQDISGEELLRITQSIVEVSE